MVSNIMSQMLLSLKHQKLDFLRVGTRLSFHLFVCFSLSALLKATNRDGQKV